MNDERVRDAFAAVPDDRDAPARAVAALARRREPLLSGRGWTLGAGLATACVVAGYVAAGLGRSPVTVDALLSGDAALLLLGFV